MEMFRFEEQNQKNGREIDWEKVLAQCYTFSFVSYKFFEFVFYKGPKGFFPLWLSSCGI